MSLSNKDQAELLGFVVPSCNYRCPRCGTTQGELAKRSPEGFTHAIVRHADCGLFVCTCCWVTVMQGRTQLAHQNCGMTLYKVVSMKPLQDTLGELYNVPDAL
jgi:hypothetical protein